MPPHLFIQKSFTTSAMQSYFKNTNLLCEWHAGFCGGYFSPSACKKQKSLVHPLSPCYLACLRYALTFLLGMSGRRHLRRPLCLCAWTQQRVSFHPLWSLCLMFLLQACVPQVYENAKLLVCCADSLFGLDVRRRCVVLSSLQVPPHFFTQKSALSTSGMH